MANAEYLKLLLETDKFYGGNNTVEQTIRLYEHDSFISCGGYNGMLVDKEWEVTKGQSDRLIPSNPYPPEFIDVKDGFLTW